MKLNVKALALSGGIVLALGVFLLTVWYLIFGYEGATLQKLHHVYLGYSISWGGAFIGLVWGFIDGFIGGALVAWLYNKFLGSASKE
jgi:hypothetical protein